MTGPTYRETEDALQCEKQRIRQESRHAESKAELLRQLLRLPSGDTARKRDLRELLDHCRGFQPLTFKNLEEAYQYQTQRLNKQYAEESYRPPAEILFQEGFEKVTRRQLLTGSWIGSYPCDAVCLSYKSGNFKGIVFEINGGSHYHPKKMSKDSYKIELLNKLGMATAEIENEDVETATTRKMVDHVRNSPTLDSRDKRNLKTRIYIETLARTHMRVREDVFLELIGTTGSETIALLEILKRYRPKLTIPKRWGDEG